MPAADCRTLLVAGTASHVGKSTVAAGLCRHLADRGVSVAPFKAQNMSNNARAVPTATGDDWGEIGVSQYTQAVAARVPATTDHNPVLLKPRGDAESQLVLDGRAVGHFEAGSYYDDHWADARAAAVAAHERLAADHDVVVAEGAGSIAEINLQDRDLANVETARFADADVLVVADIERGGAFASLYGTLELLPEDVRDRVVGAVVTKFRGDPALLADGVDEIEARTGVPVVGVIPHDDPGLPAEDSVSLSARETPVVGDDDGVPPAHRVTVGVVELPRISNFTDVAPLARTPGVRVRYLAPGAELDGVDALVVPGTKNTVDDLRALRDAGFDRALARYDGPVVGLCGGYQLLGERVTNASVESTADLDAVEGFGLLPVETAFSEEKRVAAVTRELDGAGPLAGATGDVAGYEIHMGTTSVPDGVATPVGPESAAAGRAFGTYLHGIFENECARDAFLDAAYGHADRSRPADSRARASPHDAAAELLRDHLDLGALDLPD
ncbi:MAG: cobyric acid synthase [Halobacterium sp.]